MRDLFESRGRFPSIADKIDASGDCWEWLGSKTQGYGHFEGEGAHRVVWEALVGPVPEGLEIDHLCRNRGCVNPDHLEPVPHGVNVRRGASGRYKRPDHCKQGHPFTPENTYYRPDDPTGGRGCKECRRQSNREYERRYVEFAGRWR